MLPPGCFFCATGASAGSARWGLSRRHGRGPGRGHDARHVGPLERQPGGGGDARVPREEGSRAWKAPWTPTSRHTNAPPTQRPPTPSRCAFDPPACCPHAPSSSAHIQAHQRSAPPTICSVCSPFHRACQRGRRAGSRRGTKKSTSLPLASPSPPPHTQVRRNQHPRGASAAKGHRRGVSAHCAPGRLGAAGVPGHHPPEPHPIRGAASPVIPSRS